MGFEGLGLGSLGFRASGTAQADMYGPKAHTEGRVVRAREFKP